MDCIIVRQTYNDVEAFKIAAAMQSLDFVDVVAVVCEPFAVGEGR